MNPSAHATDSPAAMHRAARKSIAGLAPATVAALGVAVVHLLVLLAHFAPAIMSPDANGYVVQARLIAEEGHTAFSPSSPVQYIGMHWLETGDGVFHSRYPAGLPVLMAAAWKAGGLTAALLVNPLLASATVLLVFLLARRLVSDGFALAAAVVFAAIPIANQHALDADAHTAATYFLTAGVLALLRFAETQSVRAGLVAGLLLGAVPTIRYPEAIVGLAVAAWLAWHIRPLTRAWPAIAGAALPIAAVLVHNAIAYGAFWKTGYALTNEQTGFGLGYFSRNALPYVQGLGGGGLALFFAFGAAGLAAMATERRTRSEGLLFVGIVVPLLLLYMAYYFGGPGGAGPGNLRFLIPTFPFFAIAGAWLLGRIAGELGSPGRVAVATALTLQLAITGFASSQALARTRSSISAAATARALAEKHVPRGSVVIVDRLLAESLDAVGAWRLAEETMVAGLGPRMGPAPGLRPALNSGDPDAGANAPTPMQAGKNRAQRARYAGATPAERRTLAWADVRDWASGKPIYWFARSVDAVADTLPVGADYESIDETDAPMMAGPGGGGPGSMPAARPGSGGPGGPGFPKRAFMPGGPGMRPRGGPGMFPPGDRPIPGAPGEMDASPAKLRLVRITLPNAAHEPRRRDSAGATPARR